MADTNLTDAGLDPVNWAARWGFGVSTVVGRPEPVSVPDPNLQAEAAMPAEDRDAYRAALDGPAGCRTIATDTVVIAAGAHVARLDGLPDAARVPVRPVKGQVLRLRDPRGPGLVERTIRGEQAYLVPRGDGRYVLGATMEERGWDTAPTAGGVYELLRDMSELVPGVLELEIEEAAAREGRLFQAPIGEPREQLAQARLGIDGLAQL